MDKEKELKGKMKNEKKCLQSNKKQWGDIIKKTSPIAFNNPTNGNSGPSTRFPSCVVPLSELMKANITFPAETADPRNLDQAHVETRTYNEPKSVDNSEQNYLDQKHFLPSTSHTSVHQTSNRTAVYYNHEQAPVQSVTFSDQKAVDNSAQNSLDQAHFLPSTSHTSSNQTILNTPTLYHNRSQAPVQTHRSNDPKSFDNSDQNYLDQTHFLPSTSHTSVHQTSNRTALYYNHEQALVQSVTFSDQKAVDNSAQNSLDQAHFLPSTSHTPVTVKKLVGRTEESDDSSCESTVSSIDNRHITSTDSEHGIGVLSGITVGKSKYFYSYIYIILLTFSSLNCRDITYINNNNKNPFFIENLYTFIYNEFIIYFLNFQ